jgi:hypothetical protein
MKPKLLVHVGFHKTGSSVLQKYYFTEKNGYLLHNEGRHLWLRIFVNKFSTESLVENEEKIIYDFTKIATERNLCAVISHERLSGYPLYGGSDRLSIYKRIQKLMEHFDVKILCVFREQNAWILSMWQQLIVDGASHPLRNFIFSDTDEGYRAPRARLEYIDYFLELKSLTSIFGKSNVLMVEYEGLFSNVNNFHNRLAYLCDTNLKASSLTLPRVNQKRKLSTIFALYFVNKLHFFPKRFRSILRICCYALPEFPCANFMNNYLLSKINRYVGDSFSESNRLLEKELEIDLAKHGYKISSLLKY